MPHESALILTLAAGFGLAFVFGMLVARLHLPPIVGYLIAGVVLGPYTPGLTADSGLASQLAEVGVILLMFGVGLHFSIKDLMAVKSIAVPGALIRIVVVTLVAALVARYWGWAWGGAIVFGLALSVASTVVVLRELDSLGLTSSGDGRIAVGWLVVEDLAMVLVLVLLPALTGAMGSGGGAGALALNLGITLLKIAAFVVLMLVVGTRVVPWVLEHVARTGSRELFTLAVLSAALGVAVGAAALFGVSFALGSFFAGVVIAESDLSHQAAADALPLQDAFAVLFFVSVGMLFDPATLIRDPVRVLVVIGIVIAFKALITFGLVLTLKRPIRSALIISTSMAQIGEFSFILAALGMELGVLPAMGRDLILAAAIVSIVVNPIVVRATNAIDRWFERRPRLILALERDRGAPLGDTAHPEMSGHVIVVGYGRVGRRIGDALRQQNIPYVAIDRDRAAINELRQADIPAIFGDAARPGILDHAHPATARILVIASPDPYQSKRVIEIARNANPAIEILARTHSEGGESYLRRQGVRYAFLGERELAHTMAHFTLMRMGRTDDQADATIDALRRATAFNIAAARTSKH